MFERFTSYGYYKKLVHEPLPYGVMAHMLLAANHTLENSPEDSPLRQPESDMYLRRLANELIELAAIAEVVDGAFADVDHGQPQTLPTVSIAGLRGRVLDDMDHEHISMQGMRSPLLAEGSHADIEIAMSDAHAVWMRQQPAR